MGRSCFFNTGVEYKFAFACQPSEDILKFGGVPTFAYEGSHKHEWTIVDRPRILGRLRDIEISLDLPEFDIDTVEKTSEGTHKLAHMLHDSKTQNTDLFATYMLGCLVYHQLLYKLDLHCIYES